MWAVWRLGCSREIADVRRRRLSFFFFPPPSLMLLFSLPIACLRRWGRYAGSGGSYRAAQTWRSEPVIHYRWQPPDLSVSWHCRGAPAGSGMEPAPPAPPKYHGKYQHRTSWSWSAHMDSAHEYMYPRMLSAYQQLICFMAPLYTKVCLWKYRGRGGMMMGHLSDWISGFKLRSNLWTFARLSVAGQAMFKWHQHN